MVAISDNFNRADSGSLGADWTEYINDWAIAGNAIRPTVLTADSYLHHNTVLASADQRAQIRVSMPSTGTSPQKRAGVLLRMDPSGAANFYLFEARYNTNPGVDGQLLITKFVAGTPTTLVSSAVGAIGASAGFDLKGEVSGTALSLYVNGVLQLSTTDSALTAGRYIGVLGRVSGSLARLLIDNFSAEDLAEVHSGGSVASADGAGAGAGVKTATGGSAAPAVGVGVGAGVKRASGGAVADATVVVVSAGARAASGGSAASATGDGVGAGSTIRGGGSTTSGVVSAVGAGNDPANNGSTATAVVDMVGAGVASRHGGSVATASAHPVTGHRKSTTGGSVCTVGVAGAGGGRKRATGGSVPSAGVDMVGTGVASRRGGAAAVAVVDMVGAGVANPGSAPLMFVGAGPVAAMFVGELPVDRVYVGDVLVFPAT